VRSCRRSGSTSPSSSRGSSAPTSSMQARYVPPPGEIPDDATTAGEVRQAAAANNRGQINDPIKGAAAIYAAVTAQNPPGRFQVGPDAIALVEGKLANVREELDAWRSLGSSTLSPPQRTRRLYRPSGCCSLHHAPTADASQCSNPPRSHGRNHATLDRRWGPRREDRRYSGRLGRLQRTTFYNYGPNRPCVTIDAFAEGRREASLPNTGTAGRLHGTGEAHLSLLSSRRLQHIAWPSRTHWSKDAPAW